MSILFSQNLLKNNEIVPQEADFTEVLESIAVTPKRLYFYGKLPEKRLKPGAKRTYERPKTVAIVGTRRPTKYGEEIAYKLALEVAKRGGVVVSGLAYGIDGIAARGALDGGGATVAVLGTPIDQIYPRAHTGLADVVVIPEAAERSGSLNTAAHALEQGREVFAAPGDITRPMSAGCNRLILQGATPYLGPEEVLNMIFPVARRKKKTPIEALAGDDAVETGILRLLAVGIQEGEEMIEKLGLSVAEFNRTVTILELKARVKALGANRWMLM